MRLILMIICQRYHITIFNITFCQLEELKLIMET